MASSARVPTSSGFYENARSVYRGFSGGPVTYPGNAILKQIEWYGKVATDGDWDYKRDGYWEYMPYGNFEYGATGRAAGFSLETLQVNAGAVSLNPDTDGAPGEIITIGDFSYATGRGAEYPYGDSYLGQELISLGYEWSESWGAVEDDFSSFNTLSAMSMRAPSLGGPMAPTLIDWKPLSTTYSVLIRRRCNDEEWRTFQNLPFNNPEESQ